MKCPMCGEEKFIHPNDDKFISFGEQYLTVKGYVCLNCGHIEFNGSNLVACYKDLKERILFLKNEIKDLESKKEKIDLKIKKLRELNIKIKSLYGKQQIAIANNQNAKEINNKIISLEKVFEKEEQDVSIQNLNKFEMELQNKKHDLFKAEEELKEFDKI